MVSDLAREAFRLLDAEPSAAAWATFAGWDLIRVSGGIGNHWEEADIGK